MEYSCIDRYHLRGDAVATCGENQKWSTETRVCTSTSFVFCVRLCLCQQLIPPNYGEHLSIGCKDVPDVHVVLELQ